MRSVGLRVQARGPVSIVRISKSSQQISKVSGPEFSEAFSLKDGWSGHGEKVM